MAKILGQCRSVSKCQEIKTSKSDFINVSEHFGNMMNIAIAKVKSIKLEKNDSTSNQKSFLENV